jgi:glucosamine--fructose-6-phosphate aminotransferase (isomerizing)
MPVVARIPHDCVYEKMLSNIEEVKARSGIVIAITDRKDQDLEDKADAVIVVPATHELLSPMLMVLPLQLLSYHIAHLRGCDVDQPRNLAKSVTVE